MSFLRAERGPFTASKVARAVEIGPGEKPKAPGHSDARVPCFRGAVTGHAIGVASLSWVRPAVLCPRRNGAPRPGVPASQEHWEGWQRDRNRGEGLLPAHPGNSAETRPGPGSGVPGSTQPNLEALRILGSWRDHRGENPVLQGEVRSLLKPTKSFSKEPICLLLLQDGSR